MRIRGSLSYLGDIHRQARLGRGDHGVESFGVSEVLRRCRHVLQQEEEHQPKQQHRISEKKKRAPFLPSSVWIAALSAETPVALATGNPAAAGLRGR